MKWPFHVIADWYRARLAATRGLAAASTLVAEGRTDEAFPTLLACVSGRHLYYSVEVKRAVELLTRCATTPEQRQETISALVGWLGPRSFWRLAILHGGSPVLVAVLVQWVRALIKGQPTGAEQICAALLVALGFVAYAYASARVTTTREHASVIAALVSLGAAESIEDLSFHPLDGPAWAAIGELASGVGADGAPKLTVAAQRRIADALHGQEAGNHVALLGKVAGAAVLPELERLAATSDDASLRASLVEILPAVRDRAERERLSASLLHPASAPTTDPDQLLRPAAGPPAVDEQQLLRPGEGPVEP